MEFYKSLSLEFYAKTIVSIPNGMEFYTMLDNTINYAIGFNYQRDGILPFYFTFSVLIYLVSIPNGMEFYDITELGVSAEICFNSQRDGILLIYHADLTHAYDVSIPNGMEFYEAFYSYL